MKIVRRCGVFETNSSSTHAVTFCQKNEDKPWRPEDDIPADEREIRSPMEKLIFLLGIMQHAIENISDEAGTKKSYYLTQVEQDFAMAKTIFTEVGIKEKGISEHALALATEDDSSPCGTDLCSRYFNRGPLSDCDCGLCHAERIYPIIGGKHPTKERLEQAAREFYDDNAYFLLTEGWYGGRWYIEQSVF